MLSIKDTADQWDLRPELDITTTPFETVASINTGVCSPHPTPDS
ncbi:hypothetical protein [Rhodococcus qingshengii]|nr:hypothetical protein [Rhodococcus qingshengii]